MPSCHAPPPHSAATIEEDPALHVGRGPAAEPLPATRPPTETTEAGAAAAETAPTRPKPRGILRHPALKVVLGLVLVLGVGFVLYETWRDPRIWDEFRERGFQPLPAIGGFLIMLATSAATAPLWMAIYRGLGGRIGARDGFRIDLVSNLGKYLPGKVGHAAGRVVMLQEKGAPASIGVTSVLVELALSLLGAVIVSLMSIPLFLREQGLSEQLGFLTFIAFLALPAGLIGLHPRIMGPVLKLGSRALPGGATLSTELPPYRAIMVLLLGYVLLWATMSVGLFVTVHAIYSLSWEYLPAIAGVAAISYLFGLAVPFAPAGIGAREGLMTAMLQTMMPLPVAIVTSVLYRGVSVSAEALAAALAATFARDR